jgi:CHAD domain-containing protein
MGKAFDQPSDERFHEWRKRVKDHWYHMRLLSKVWPKVTAARIDELSRLSDLLGDDHDLGVLIDTLERESNDLEGDTQTLACLAQRRQGELRSEARLLGARLYAPEPDCLADELRDYWRIWRS